MFDIFCESMKNLADRYSHDDIKFIFKLGEPSENRSARLEIDTQDLVAEIVVWNSCDYIAEIVNVSTEQSIFKIFGELSPDQKFEDVFSSFFKILRVSPE